MADEGRKSNVLDLARAVWRRRKWLGLLAFAVPFTAALSVVLFLPDIYGSSATILVERQQVPEAFVRPTVTSGLDTRLHTISQEILSRTRLDSLIARFGLYSDLRDRVPREEVIERMRRDIRLELKGGEQRRRGGGTTVAFAVSYRGSRPETVAQVTNTLASFYIEENLKVREKQATGTAEFLKVQLEETKKRLDQQEHRLGEFKTRHMGELPQQMQANLSTLEQLNQRLRLNSDNQLRAAERRESLIRQLAEGDFAVRGGTPAAAAAPADPTAARLFRLRQELTELRTRFTDKYPDVVRVKSEIVQLEQELAARPQPEPKPGEPAREPQPLVPPGVARLKQSLDEAEAEIKLLKAEEQRLRSSIATYQARVENAPAREQELVELSRDYDTTKQLYATLMQRYDEAQLAESMEQRQKGEQFRIIEGAVPSAVPAAPNRGRLTAMALVLSLGLAVGAILLAEQLDTSFHSVDDLRAVTTVPVLASIPRIMTDADRATRRRRFQLAAASAVLGLSGIVTAAYVVAHGNEWLVGLLLTGSRS
jgi:protein tyrosine kinase modulator